MNAVSTADAHAAWVTAERIKRISDRLIGLGPFSVGVDGMLAWIPLAGTLYSMGAGVWLLSEASRVQASRATLARMVFYLGFRTLASLIPLEGAAVDFLFRGHLMAANALQKDIARRYGPPPAAALASAFSWPFRSATPSANGTRA